MRRRTAKRPKAYSYLRFSTPEQQQGDSQRRQTRLAENYAAGHGLDLDDKLTFQDLGVSAYQGKNVETGQLGAFLEAVRTGFVERGSYLLVESLDRISRQAARKALKVLGDICDEGITVVTLTDNREYTEDSLNSDPMSLLMSLLVFIRANEESLTKARRLKAAWEGKRETVEETPLTAQVPGWLTLVGRVKSGKHMTGGTFKVNPERAAVVRRIFKMALRGIGQHAIAQTLNRERVPVFGRGQHWHRSYVSKLLSSPTVIGTFTPHVFEHKNGKRHRKPLDAIPGYYPAVVDEDVFQRVQSLRQAASPLRGRHAKNGTVRNLFGGLVVCPKCGGSMTLVYKGAPPKGGTYLVCAKARVKAGCRYHAIRYEPIEAAFLGEAKRLLNTVPAGNRGNGIDKELENVDAALEALPEQIDNLVTAIQRDQRRGISSAAMSQRLRTLETELEHLRERHSDLLQQQADAAGALVAHKVADLKEALSHETLNRAEVNALLRQLLAGVVVEYDNGRLLLNWKHGGESDVTYAWPKQKLRRRTSTQAKAKQERRRAAKKARRQVA